jgi:hypothetical protein
MQEMDKQQLPAISIPYFIVPVLSLSIFITIVIKSSREYNVVDIDSPNVVLCALSSFPYFLTFVFSFFAKTETHRKAFYGALGLLAFMTAFEWIGPKTQQMRDIYTVIWFFQTVFIVPFLMATIKGEKKT